MASTPSTQSPVMPVLDTTTSSTNTTSIAADMASLSLSPPTSPVPRPPSTSNLIAPRPIRAPAPIIYRPIPQRLSKPILIFDAAKDSSSSSSGATTNTTTTTEPSQSPSPLLHHQRRRSSSAASTTSQPDTAATSTSTTSRLAELAEHAAESAQDTPTGLYPSKDVLDELYKIIRCGRSYPFANFRELSSAASGGRNTPGSPAAGASSGNRRLSVGSSGGRTPTPGEGRMLVAKSPDGSRIIIPSSPVARTTMRNPIIFNQQFGVVKQQQ